MAMMSQMMTSLHPLLPSHTTIWRPLHHQPPAAAAAAVAAVAAVAAAVAAVAAEEKGEEGTVVAELW